MAPSIDPDIQTRRQLLVETRRILHRNAQLSFQETFACSLVEDRLRKIDGVTDVKTGWARAPAEFKGATPENYIREETGTGVTATILGTAGEGPCIAFRADMDALPIPEESEKEYCSKNEGVMHACGHDGHVAMLLLAAEVIAARRHHFCGSVQLLFQPAEEFGGGARYMVKEGALKGVSQVFGIHLFTPLQLGTIGVKGGPLMAAPDKFAIDVQGKGGHGAMPQLSVDAMLCASQINVSLQTVVSRTVAPLEPACVSVCKMENEIGTRTCGCGHAFNVIAGRVVMHGTARSFNDSTQSVIRKGIERVANGVAEAMGATASTTFDDLNFGYPATINTPAEAELMKQAAVCVVGEENVKSGTEIMTLGAEDFSFYLKEVPGCFVFVGATRHGEEVMPHHHPSFDFDEEALEIGASLWVRLTEVILGGSGHSNQKRQRV
eukprot:TRINITY_DN109356_c0_g1_i1.p1 TRINITY_DN109356_c0_g1~~TRINITY_DN109356_c0_g1_i1.p1  ORF type:complete len:450 (+),score=90.07 TRINITY_DN109356_c0_g1_i1:42-1352(+)